MQADRPAEAPDWASGGPGQRRAALDRPDFVGRAAELALLSDGLEAAERARQSVTKAIREALDRIERHDRALGAHLRHAVRTGTMCAYVPDPRSDVRWITKIGSVKSRVAPGPAGTAAGSPRRPSPSRLVIEATQQRVGTIQETVMETIFAPATTSTESPNWRRWLTSAVLVAILAAVLVAAYVVEASISSPTDAAGDAGLSAKQIVTRGEVADRYAAGDAGLSPQQIVTRSEVADRYAK